MTHPTDEELEAMAREMFHEHKTLCLMVGAEPDVITTPAKRSAAMLRACKSPDPDARQAGWRAGIEAAAKIANKINAETTCESCCDAAEIAMIILALAEKGPDR